MEFILPRILIQLYAEQFPLEVGSMGPKLCGCLSRLHGHGNIEMATTRGYVTNSLKYTRHACPTRLSDTTRLQDRSVRAT